MRIFLSIALLLLAGAAWADAGPTDSAVRRIDSIETRIMNFLVKKEMGSYGPAESYAEEALERSRRESGRRSGIVPDPSAAAATRA